MSVNVSYSSSSEYERYKLCVRFPPKTHSLGIWEIKDPLTYALPSLEAQMVVIFALTHLLHYPLKRLGLPKLFSEIMAGILLGPTLPKAARDLTKSLFPVDTQATIATLSVFGFMLFIFLFGVKTDLGLLHTSGKKAYWVAVLGLELPLIIGAATAQMLIRKFIGATNVQRSSLIFVSVTQALSPFPVVVLLLKDLKILNSELGRLASNSAIVSELLSASLNFIMNTSKSFNEHQSAFRTLQDIGLTFAFALIVIYVIRPAILWVIRKTPEGRPVNDFYIYMIILLVLISGAFTHWVKQGAILGPFIVGLAIPDGLPLGSALSDRLDSFVSGLFLPLFMSFISMRANLRAIKFSDPVQISIIVIIAVSFVVKVVACVIPTWFCRVPLRDALALGLIMSAKGVVEMSIYSFFRDEGNFSEQVFTLLVTSTAVLSVIVPILVNRLYDPSRKYVGYLRRSIIKSKHDHELRIIMCIHRPDNIPAYINLLDISCPLKENPLVVYVLNLIELKGRASSIFISHHIQQEKSHLYSQDVIFAFSRHERVHYEAVYTQAYTAISPRKLMHEDICTLSLDKKAALIIIPFHRKWAVDGSIETDDIGLRALNTKILDMAPCSVGVLIDRGRQKGQNVKSSTQNAYSGRKYEKSVAVIFFGGSDDREALTYAKRMTRDPDVTLTVVRFVSSADEEKEVNEREEILDSEVMDEITNQGGDRILYIEETVDDGAETALMVREMVTEFDMIIVGRNKNVEFAQTSGLQEWSEFSELGVVGDILASSDLKLRASVLVVQQQKQKQILKHR